MRFLLRLLVTASALWAAVAVVPGIRHAGPWWELIGVALVFGVVNALVRPLLVTLTCPLVLLTLGLFLLVLNGVLLWLTAAVSGALGLDFVVDGFLPALIGALVVSVVSAVLNVLVGTERKEKAEGR